MVVCDLKIEKFMEGPIFFVILYTPLKLWYGDLQTNPMNFSYNIAKEWVPRATQDNLDAAYVAWGLN